MSLPQWPEVCIAGEQTVASPSYQWTNKGRATPELCVIQWTLEGEGYIDCEGQRFIAAREQAMLFTHDDGHAYGYPEDATLPYRFRFLSFNPGFLRPLFVDIRERFGPVIQFASREKAAAHYTDLFHAFLEPRIETAPSHADGVWNLLTALFEEQRTAQDRMDPILRGRRLILEDIRGLLSVKEIADQVGLSREHFVRSFTQRYGEGPGKLRRRLRLTRAERMLKSSDLPLDAIAAACGFSNADALRRSYRDYFGHSPSSVRPGV